MNNHDSQPYAPSEIPWARPVTMAEGFYAPAAYTPSISAFPPLLSRKRSAFELLLMASIVFMAVIWVIGILNILLEDFRWAPIASNLALGVTFVLVIAAFTYLGGLNRTSVGLHSTAPLLDSVIGIVSLWITYVVLAVSAMIIYEYYPEFFEQAANPQEIIKQNFPQMPLAIIVPLMLFVAFWEELFFRGFVLTRLHGLLRSRVAAVILQAILFGLIHGYEGYLGIFAITIFGIVMGTITLLRKSLLPAIIFHMIQNVTALMLAYSIEFPTTMPAN